MDPDGSNSCRQSMMAEIRRLIADTAHLWWRSLRRQFFYDYKETVDFLFMFCVP